MLIDLEFDGIRISLNTLVKLFLHKIIVLHNVKLAHIKAQPLLL